MAGKTEGSLDTNVLLRFLLDDVKVQTEIIEKKNKLWW